MEFESLEPRQKKIYNLLLKKNALASQAYFGAIFTLNQEDNPDRFQQVANSIRHVSGLISRDVNIEYDKSEYKDLINLLNDILKRCNFGEKYEVTKLEIKHITQKEKIKLKITHRPDVLPEMIQERINILISEWHKIHQYFHKIAHYSSEIVKESEFFGNFNLFEGKLLELFKSSDETKRNLDKLINVSEPEDSHIKILSKYISKPADSHYFFTKLINPNWFELLKKYNFFAEPEGSDSGSFMIHFFPQMNYLKAVASEIPDKILKILFELQNTQNIILRRSIVVCIKNLPIEYVIKTDKIIKKITQSPDIALHSILKEICIDTILKNEFKFVIEVLKSIFVFKDQSRASEDLLRFLLSGHKDLLKPIIDSKSSYLKIEFMKILCDLLSKYIEKEVLKGVLFNIKIKKLDIEITEDTLLKSEHSEIWRNSIEDLPYSYKSGDFVGLLLDEIRDIFVELYESDKDVFIKIFNLISNYPWMLYKRLQVYLIDKTFPMLKAKLSLIINQELLFKEKQVWTEIYHLLKNHFSQFSQEQKGKYFNWIYEEFDNFNEKETSKKYLLRIINPILKDLPEDFVKNYSGLIEQSKSFNSIYKTPPDIFTYLEPVKFLDPSIEFKEDLENKTIEEIIQFLNSWKPTGKKIFESPSELGFALSKQISQEPNEYLILLENFKKIPISFLSNIIYGFGRAIYDKKAFDYEKCINYLFEIAEYFQNSSNIEIDYILSLFEEIENVLNNTVKLELFSFTENSLQKIIKISKIILETKNPKYKPYEEAENIHENRIFYYYSHLKAKTIETLVNLNQKFLDAFKKEKDEPFIHLEIENIFNNLLETHSEDKEIVNAMFGYNLYKLFYFDIEWTKNQIKNIFPEEKENRNKWMAAWESYIIIHKQFLNEIALKHLEKHYKMAIDKVQSPNISLRAKEALSTHIFLAYLHGHMDLDKGGFIYLYFKQGDIDTRSRAMWDYFKNIYPYAKQKGNTILDRYFDLWDYRIGEIEQDIKNKKITAEDAFNELKWYGVLFSEIIDYSDDLILRMEKIVDITNGISDVFIDNILKVLKEYININFRAVLKILSKYIQIERESAWLWFNKVDVIRTILEDIKKMIKNNEDKALYNRIIDDLHAKGYDINGFPLE